MNKHFLLEIQLITKCLNRTFFFHKFLPHHPGQSSFRLCSSSKPGLGCCRFNNIAILLFHIPNGLTEWPLNKSDLVLSVTRQHSHTAQPEHQHHKQMRWLTLSHFLCFTSQWAGYIRQQVNCPQSWQVGWEHEHQNWTTEHHTVFYIMLKACSAGKPWVHVDVTLTQTTYQNAAAIHKQPFVIFQQDNEPRHDAKRV